MSSKKKVNKDAEEVVVKICGGEPLIWVETHEEKRTLTSVLEEIDWMNKHGSISDEGEALKYSCFTWDRADGIRQVSIKEVDGQRLLAMGEPIPKEIPDPDHDVEAKDKAGNVIMGKDGEPVLVPAVMKVPSIDPRDPVDFLNTKAPAGTVMFLKDYHKYFDQDHFQGQDVVLRTIRNRIELFQCQFKSLIILSSVVRIPDELEKDMKKITFSLPNRDELKDILKDFCEQAESIKYPTTDEAAVVDAGLGLTSGEFLSALSESASKTKGRIDPVIIREQKAEQVKKAGLLDVISTTESLETIGGLENLKAWIMDQMTCSSEEAKEFGCATPKGALFVGLPGTGKSLTAKAIATVTGRPLLRFDIGKVFDQYQGNSEMKMRRCLAVAEAVSPCILWIDEIEKGMAGTSGSSAGDSHGTTKRVFGTMLTWLSEKTADVFIVATANNVNSIPSELYRPGRIDATFWLDLPDSVQREQILRIHIKKSLKNGKPRDPDTILTAVDMKTLVDSTKDRSGAALEVLVKSAVAVSWKNGKGRRDVVLSDFQEALKKIPKTNKEAFAEAYAWKKKNAVPDASINHEEAVEPAVAPSIATTLSGNRKIAIQHKED
jgi:ATP-dependent 26S proteasome regulatory subunit